MPLTLTITLSDAQVAHIAETLAPLVRGVATLDPTPITESPETYDPPTCAEFVRPLGEGVIERAIILYQALRDDGKIDSVTLASRLGLESPSTLAGALTTSLKRRAEHLGLPHPFDGGQGLEPYGGITTPGPEDDPERTYWADRDGMAERMLAALENEHEVRKMTVAERIERVLAIEPGLSDSELRERLDLRHQHVNAECRRLEQLGRIERRKRRDGVIGNFPVV